MPSVPGKGNGGRRAGAGPKIKTATIRAGNPVMISQLLADGSYGHIGKGVVTIDRDGSSRIVRVALDDGSTIQIMVF